MVWTTLDSIAHGIYRYVCPLYWIDDRERVYVAGSAVPFEHKGFRCLLTAAHVCFYDAIRPQPVFTNGNLRPWALTELRGVWQYEPAHTTDIDLGVIALTDDCADDLATYYRFSNAVDLSTVLPRSNTTCYMIAGYPSSRNRVRSSSQGLPSKATFFVMRDTFALSDLRATDKSDDAHFALSVPDTHRRVGGGQFHVPDLHGMSGGGIWRFEIDNRTQLVTTPSLVGIGIEYHKTERVVLGTRIQAATPLLEDLVSQTRSKVLPSSC